MNVQWKTEQYPITHDDMDDEFTKEVDEYRGTFATEDEISHVKWTCSEYGGD